MRSRVGHKKSRRGCVRCKARRVKCDEVHPTCSSCVRHGVPCEYVIPVLHLGKVDHISQSTNKSHAPKIEYTTSFSLAPYSSNIRYETHSVVQKAQADQNAKNRRGLGLRNVGTAPRSRKEASSWATSEFTSLGSQDVLPTTSGELIRIQRAISPSIESQAMCFFLRNYVRAESDASNGFMDHFISWRISESETLSAAIAALSMAQLSNIRRDIHLLVKARQKYAFALQRTKEHLRDQIEARTDQTFAVVTLLGLFEIMTCTSLSSTVSWTNHIHGIIALLQLRGKELLESADGSKLFMGARVQLLLSWFQIESRVPCIVFDLVRQSGLSKSPIHIAADTLFELTANISDLRVSVREGLISDPLSIISSFLALDGQLTAWKTRLPSMWNYRTIFTFDYKDEIYEDIYHVYQNAWVASTWNIYRSGRIWVHEGILLQTNKANYEDESPTSSCLRVQNAQSQATISEMAHDICASIPAHLGHDTSRLPQTDCPQPEVPAFFLVPFLYLAASWVGVPRSMKEYIAGRLWYIGHGLGIQHAVLQADFLRNTLNVTSPEATKGEDESQNGEDVKSGQSIMVSEVNQRDVSWSTRLLQDRQAGR